MLELINRARANPAREGVILDTTDTPFSRQARRQAPSFFKNLRAEFASLAPVPPLAFNPRLIQSAQAHSQDMLSRGYMAHVNPEGADPSARAAAAGYDNPAAENISGSGATTGSDVAQDHFGLMVDCYNVDTSQPLGHRLNLLNGDFSETGVGIRGTVSSGRVTQDFGTAPRSYILGVAYNDANGNGAYDPGEGMAGVSVKPVTGNWYAVTSASGGFAIPIDPVETTNATVNLPFPVQTSTWDQVQPYDQAYRKQQMQNAPSFTVRLTWSGGALAAPKVTSVVIKRPVLINYKLTGTDGWQYSFSMLTAANAKTDLRSVRGTAVVSGGRQARDVNGDGLCDLFFQNSAGQVASWLLNGKGANTHTLWLSSKELGDLKFAGVADMDGDQIADLVFQNAAGQLIVWSLDGNGNVTRQWTLYAGNLGDWKVAALGDVNGDGIPDFVFQNAAGQALAWAMDGKGNCTSQISVCSGGLGDWKIAGIADISGDGIPDLIFQNTPGQIAAWLMDGKGRMASSLRICSSPLGDWKIAAIGDANGDGIPDLIFQNASGQVAAWLLDGKCGVSSGAWLSPGALGDWRVR